jgi:F-type H+-transporting ATPase subunit b
MDIVIPGIGLVFWTTIVFIILVFLLAKFAWAPILKSVNKRNDSIEQALKQAEIAREEMDKLKLDHESLAKEARLERDNILSEAREMKEKMFQTAKEETENIVVKMKNNAIADIESQKNAAINELKQQVANVSIEIAEKILKAELEDNLKQEAYVNRLLEDVKLN